eukprot:TRINITY_DN1347_c0_g2_i2.p3 TRINITY_DN1347_c0_g2~~TRINITY_DN1347_c0_g2_i2.p3  ORF type:complete len:145 (-),score=66.57 TRINITY_DN1347_c0_g2_i2:1259-1693(-)
MQCLEATAQPIREMVQGRRGHTQKPHQWKRRRRKRKTRKKKKKKKKKKKEKEKEKEKDYHHDSIEMEDERMSREFASRPTDEEDSERHSIIQYLTVKSVRDAQRLMDDSLSEEWKCLTERHGSRTRRRDIRSVFGGEDTSSAKE